MTNEKLLIVGGRNVHEFSIFTSAKTNKEKERHYIGARKERDSFPASHTIMDQGQDIRTTE